MSRNFELMQNLGRERELYDAEPVAEGRIAPPVVASKTQPQSATSATAATGATAPSGLGLVP